MRATLACAVALGGLAAGVTAAPVPKPKDDSVPAVTKEHLAASQSNLRQIALAVIAYSDSNNAQMPTNVTDKDGKALLSWRVLVLPYMEEETLYKQFKLDEPWDSAHNKKLAEKMPKVFAPVRVKAKVGETFYQVFSGDGALFGPKQQPRFPASIPDGTANTVMVAEAGTPVIWTKPEDIPFDANKPLPKLGGLFDGEFHVAMCDGEVVLYKKDYDADEMKKAITPADGFPIDFDKLKK